MSQHAPGEPPDDGPAPRDTDAPVFDGPPLSLQEELAAARAEPAPGPDIDTVNESLSDGLNRCPRCGATDVRLRASTGMLVCLFCRHEWQEARVEEELGLGVGIEELDGTVVAGDARGGTLGFPTANVALRADLLVPLNGIYAGSTAAPGASPGHRAAMSVGLNPHYGGEELRVEAFLLEFAGDLYGKRLVVEVWQRLREERAFPSEADLVAQIAADVEETRAATRPE